MNQEQLACALMLEYETNLPSTPGLNSLGQRVTAMLAAVQALNLVESVKVMAAPVSPLGTPPPFVPMMAPVAPLSKADYLASAESGVILKPIPTEGDSGHA